MYKQENATHASFHIKGSRSCFCFQEIYRTLFLGLIPISTSSSLEANLSKCHHHTSSSFLKLLKSYAQPFYQHFLVIVSHISLDDCVLLMSSCVNLYLSDYEDVLYQWTQVGYHKIRYFFAIYFNIS
jgi:hypothetical protein